MRCGGGSGEVEQQPPRDTRAALKISAWDSRIWELGGEVAGYCRELVAGGTFILWIYGLVCYWLDLQAGLADSTSLGTHLCTGRLYGRLRDTKDMALQLESS